MGAHAASIWELNRTLNDSIPAAATHSHSSVPYTAQAHLLAVTSITPNTASPISSSANTTANCPRCKDGHDPNC